jgi:hypothetical protein
LFVIVFSFSDTLLTEASEVAERNAKRKENEKKEIAKFSLYVQKAQKAHRTKTDEDLDEFFDYSRDLESDGYTPKTLLRMLTLIRVTQP